MLPHYAGDCESACGESYIENILRSRYGRSEAYDNYQQMRLVWRGDSCVKDLADLFHSKRSRSASMAYTVRYRMESWDKQVVDSTNEATLANCCPKPHLSTFHHPYPSKNKILRTHAEYLADILGIFLPAIPTGPQLPLRRELSLGGHTVSSRGYIGISSW